MTFSQAIGTVFSKYATFQGRAGRPEFWWWVLFVILVSLVTQFIDGMFIGPMLGYESFDADGGQPLSLVVSLGLLLPNLAVSVRRLHDIDRSGWWLLIGLVPLIGVIVLIFWYVQPGTEGGNRFD